MIRKGDILTFKEHLEEGDDEYLLIALEDECTPANVPMVKVAVLNSGLVLPPVNFFEASHYKVVGHVKDTNPRG